MSDWKSNSPVVSDWKDRSPLANDDANAQREAYQAKAHEILSTEGIPEGIKLPVNALMEGLTRLKNTAKAGVLGPKGNSEQYLQEIGNAVSGEGIPLEMYAKRGGLPENAVLQRGEFGEYIPPALQSTAPARKMLGMAGDAALDYATPIGAEKTLSTLGNLLEKGAVKLSRGAQSIYRVPFNRNNKSLALNKKGPLDEILFSRGETPLTRAGVEEASARQLENILNERKAIEQPVIDSGETGSIYNATDPAQGYIDSLKTSRSAPQQALGERLQGELDAQRSLGDTSGRFVESKSYREKVTPEVSVVRGPMQNEMRQFQSQNLNEPYYPEMSPASMQKAGRSESLAPNEIPNLDYEVVRKPGREQLLITNKSELIPQKGYYGGERAPDYGYQDLVNVKKGAQEGVSFGPDMTTSEDKYWKALGQGARDESLRVAQNAERAEMAVPGTARNIDAKNQQISTLLDSLPESQRLALGEARKAPITQVDAYLMARDPLGYAAKNAGRLLNYPAPYTVSGRGLQNLSEWLYLHGKDLQANKLGGMSKFSPWLNMINRGE